MNAPLLASELLTAALRALVEDTLAAQRRVLAAPSAAEDEEALHDFRVALRRMRTYLRVGRSIWGRKRLARIEGELRYHAQATGGLRDEEVLRETLGALPLPPEARSEVGGWLVRRARAARRQLAVVERLLREGPRGRIPAVPGGKPVRRLERSLAALIERLDGAEAAPTAAVDLALGALADAERDIAAWAARDVNDVEAMHALRIRYKRLRYSAELFAALLGAEASRIAKSAARMQKRLGELHDIDQAWLTVTSSPGLSAATRGAVASALGAARVACASKLAPHLARAARAAERVPDDEPPEVS